VNDFEARRHAFSEWWMELSVLWAVFPLLDWLVEGEPVGLGTLALSFAISLTSGLIGLILRRGDRR